MLYLIGGSTVTKVKKAKKEEERYTPEQERHPEGTDPNSAPFRAGPYLNMENQELKYRKLGHRNQAFRQ